MKKLQFIFFIPLVIFSSCRKENRWDLFKGTGARTTETRSLPSFNKIFLKNNINVFISEGSTQDVRIEAGKKLLPLIKTEVVNGELHLWNENTCNWARSYKKGIINVYLTVPSLNFITNFGSGNIFSTDTIHCDTLTVRTHESGDIELNVKSKNILFVQMGGTGDVKLHGTSPLMGIFHLGEGFLYGNDFQSDFTWTTSKASGNEFLTARKSLFANIEWAGDVYYSGKPADVGFKITGIGKLIPLD